MITVFGRSSSRSRSPRGPRGAGASKRPMRPRRPVWRDRLKKTLIVMSGVGLVASLPFAARHAYRSVAGLNFFAVEEVQMVGLRHVRSADFIRYVGDQRGKSILELDVETILWRASSHPWVKSAVVKRELPSTLRVEVEERVPAAIAETGSGRFLVDTEGLALARIAGPEWDYLPVIGYSGAKGLKVVDDCTAKEIRTALELLDYIKSDPSEMFAGASVLVDGDGTPCINYEGAVIRVGTGGYDEKLRRFAEVAADIEKRGARPTLIDLRFPGKVVVKGGRAPRSG